jgi:excisionase family DNA binding protein
MTLRTAAVELLTPAEVAARFKVSAQSVARWGASGRLLSTRTPGNHRRYFAAEVDALLRGESPEQARKIARAEYDRLTRIQGRRR